MYAGVPVLAPTHQQPVAAQAVAQPALQPAPVVEAPLATPKVLVPVLMENTETITSPMVGTFYQSPAPEAPPYVELGQLVKVGQPVCILEAMKLMNEIESEVEGKIVQIMVENGQPVEFGQPLFIIQK